MYIYLTTIIRTQSEINLSHCLNFFSILESKIYSFFPRGQFYVQGYLLPYRLDKTLTGSLILLYTRENIPPILIHTKIQWTFVLLKLKAKVCLLYFSFNSPKYLKFLVFQKKLEAVYNKHSSNYQKFILLVDFNSKANDPAIKICDSCIVIKISIMKNGASKINKN